MARLLCGLTFLVVGLGGLVTTTKAGMAVPDWPSTYGYNLFLYPWETWVFGPRDLFVEHGHRLAASAAGLVTIVLALLLWRDRTQPRWRAWMGLIALALVVAQGLLGGMRVLLDDRLVALIHAVIGPMFFCVTVAFVMWTSRWWQRATPLGNDSALDLRAAGLLLLVVTYTQVLLGASLRHLTAEFSPQTFLAIARFHLLFAAIVAGTWLAIACWPSRAGVLRGPIRWVGMVLAMQILLGLVTWCYKYAVPTWVEQRTGWTLGTIVADGLGQSIIVTAHQANGSLLLATSVWLLLAAWRVAPAILPAPAVSLTNPTGPLRRATQ